MNDAKKRKYHSPEFKAKVGLEALCGVKTINEIGQEYGVHPVQVGQWKKEIQVQASTLFEGKRGPKPLAAHREPELLYSEIGKLKMELDWLKKSPGSTCRDPARVDRRGGCGGCCPAMRAGQRLPCYGLCAAKNQAGR
jgi:transposase-like protein